MFEPKNYDNSFVRNIIVGLSSFLYDVIEIKQTEKGVIKLKRVPFFYSFTGEEQFITDYFLNTDKYCNVLSPKVEGNVTRIPSGVFSLSNAGVDPQRLGSGYTRADYKKEFETDFSLEERDMSARTDFVPVSFDFESKVKCGSDIERLKIFEEIIKKFYKVKKFWIKYEGFHKIPVTVSFPDQYNIAKNFQFRYPDNETRPQMIFQLQVIGWLPVIDEKTERFAAEHIDDFTTILKPRKPQEDEEDKGENPNEEFKLEN